MRKPKERRVKSTLLQELVQTAPVGRKSGEGAEAVETEEQRALTIRLPRSLLRALKVYAAQNDTTMQAVILRLLQDFLKTPKS